MQCIGYVLEVHQLKEVVAVEITRRFTLVSQRRCCDVAVVLCMLKTK